MDICHEFNVDGARLSALIQSQMYKLLRMTAGITEWSSAQMLVKQVMATLKNVNSVEPLHTRRWRLIQHKDVS